MKTMLPGSAAFATTSRLLKLILMQGLANLAPIGLGSADVTLLPPDRIVVGNDELPRLNVFLYQITPHIGLRAQAEQREAAPLAFDAYYLLTAYGAQELEIEQLLGYAVQLLHHSSRVMLRDRRWYTARSPHYTFSIAAEDAASAEASLTSLVITPQFLAGEDLARLWSSLQARYRPSVAYKVTPGFA